MSQDSRTETTGHTWGEDLPGVAHGATSVSHGRYLLGDVIGTGGFGQVHRATDRLTGEAVAIKFVPALSPADLARTRRELAALRWLRLPGVVRLRDDGLDGTSWFLVMDLVEGQPFDQLRTDGGWDSWSGPVLELLEILARVHLTGVLHLDLKPSNILVDHRGRVVVLDFGVARGRAVPEVDQNRIEGTPRYMAPEQLLGGPCDVRTDLYAVGVMLTEMANVPAPVRAVLTAMCASSPEDRPASALAAYRALAGRSPVPTLFSREEVWTREALRRLFAGSDTFTHVPSDAADLLWERTSGRPSDVASTLEGWILAGQIGWHDGLLVIDRLALEQLRGGQVFDLLGEAIPPLLVKACLRARELRKGGRLDGAIVLLDAVAPLARSLDTDQRVEFEQGLVEERVLAALAMERPDAVELALYALERAEPTAPILHLTLLVRMVRAVLRRDGSSAQAHAVEPGTFEQDELEIQRQGFRARGAAISGHEAEGLVLRELDSWASGNPLREAKLAGWRGNHLYRRCQYRESAHAHEQAIAGKIAPIERLSSTMSAGLAWLEALDLPRAQQRAQEAALLGRELRHPRFEAFAVWALRTVAYRSGRPFPPDRELLAAASELGPDLEPAFAATDAATAYRLGDRPTCIELADRAAVRFAAASIPPGVLLMRALSAFASHADPAVLRTLADQAHGCAVPDIELQVLAFARWRCPDPPAAWLDRIRTLAALRPPEQWPIRLDVLSIDESLGEAPPGGALG